MSDKDLLDEYLDGESELSELYALTKQAPDSSRVDDAVLAAAKRDLKAQPTTVVKKKRLSWLVPLSAAATVVLTATLYVSNRDVIDNSAPAAPASMLKEADQQSMDAAEQSNAPELRTQQRQIPAPAQAPARLMMEKKSKVVTADAPSTDQPAAQIEAEEALGGSRYQALTDAVTPMPADKTEPQLESKPMPARSLATSPDVQVHRIRQLIEAGKLDQARQQLSTLIEAFPGYELPDDLKAFSKTQ